ncbi:hypothetical protein H696_02166 [Fonticula alba]|uniref:Uncharacterized protein n=1 Tax=Fonticula alba TaxID=691883 RepID=A0A058ZAB1_FONAL|nr:hypothetical protein H696_02166 [Fonticula alba]KCV71215.1 hypothetical protein H696_02166 [Fonticula alba]|eukprot:XP_009494338.1 hypothetical protein H696_02166 [Fonticula alba]
MHSLARRSIKVVAIIAALSLSLWLLVEFGKVDTPQYLSYVVDSATTRQSKASTEHRRYPPGSWDSAIPWTGTQTGGHVARPVYTHPSYTGGNSVKDGGPPTGGHVPVASSQQQHQQQQHQQQQQQQSYYSGPASGGAAASESVHSRPEEVGSNPDTIEDILARYPNLIEELGVWLRTHPGGVRVFPQESCGSPSPLERHPLRPWILDRGAQQGPG